MSKLTKAKQVIIDITKQIQALNDKEAGINANASIANTAVAEFQGLQAKRKGLLTRMLEAGGLSDSKEIKAVNNDIAKQQAEAEQAADILAVKQELLSKIHQERFALYERLEQAQTELALAKFEQLTAEIKGEAITEFQTAKAEFERALGKLVGMGIANCEIASQLRQKGYSLQSVGIMYPDYSHILQIVGFGFCDGFMNHVKIDATEHIHAAKAEALKTYGAEQ